MSSAAMCFWVAVQNSFETCLPDWGECIHVHLHCPCCLGLNLRSCIDFLVVRVWTFVRLFNRCWVPPLQGIVAVAVQRCVAWHSILSDLFHFVADWPMQRLAILSTVCIHTGSRIEGWTTSLIWRRGSTVLHLKHHRLGIAKLHPGSLTVNRSCPPHPWAAEGEAVLRAEMVHLGRCRVLPNPKPHFHTNYEGPIGPRLKCWSS